MWSPHPTRPDQAGPCRILPAQVLGGIEVHRGLNTLDATLPAPGPLLFTPEEYAANLPRSVACGRLPEVTGRTGGSAWLPRTARNFALHDAGPFHTLLERTREAVLSKDMLRVVGSGPVPEDVALRLRLGTLRTFTPEAVGHLNGGRAAGNLTRTAAAEAPRCSAPRRAAAGRRVFDTLVAYLCDSRAM